MATETVLADAEIITIGQQARAVEPGKNGYILPVTFARAIEQAVLQSPEIQALRRDAERILFIADDGCEFATWIQDDYTTKYRLEWNRGAEWQSEWFDTPEDAIDAAIRSKQ